MAGHVHLLEGWHKVACSRRPQLIEDTAMKMKKTQFSFSIMLPAVALMVALCFLVALSFAIQPLFGQSADDASRVAATQQPSAQLQSQSQFRAQNGGNALAVMTFSGRIVKSGNKLLLTDADNQVTYQLDDQRKAQHFLNPSVKVRGVLDAVTGTIRIAAIQPA